MSTILLREGYEPNDRLLSLRDLAELVGLKASATKALVRRPDFPPAVRLSQRTPRWWRSEVERWLESHRSAYSAGAMSSYCRTRRRPARTH